MALEQDPPGQGVAASDQEATTPCLLLPPGMRPGRWLSQQRRAMRAGTIPSEQAADLDELGIMWEPADEAWEENPGSRTRVLRCLHLAAPLTAAILDKLVGQWLPNARKKGGLGKHPKRARKLAKLLTAIDPDWKPG